MTTDLQQFISRLECRDQAGLLAALVGRLVAEWTAHAALIRPENGAAAAALQNVSIELQHLLEVYFRHLLEETGWVSAYSRSAPLHDRAMAEPTQDLWQVDLLMRDLALPQAE